MISRPQITDKAANLESPKSHTLSPCFSRQESTRTSPVPVPTLLWPSYSVGFSFGMYMRCPCSIMARFQAVWLQFHFSYSRCFSQPLFAPEAMESTTAKKPRKKRDQNYFHLDSPWQNKEGVSSFPNEIAVRTALWEIAKEGWNGTPTNGQDFVKHNQWVSGKGDQQITKQKFSCHYETRGGVSCPYKVLLCKDRDGVTQVFESRHQHCDHAVGNATGVNHSLVAEALSSPSKLQKAPLSLVKAVMSKSRTHEAVSLESQEKTRRAIQRRKKKSVEESLGGCSPDSVAGLRHSLKSFVIDKAGEDFDEHTVFLVGSEFLCREDLDNKSYKIAALLSTENLLLNAYRQTCTGVDMSFAVDASYRYNFQGYPLIPIKVINFSQTAKAVGWALVSNDDVDCHEFVFEMLKKGVEDAVTKFYSQGSKHEFASREDNDLFSHDVDEDWTYSPDHTLTLVKDSATAARLAAESVWLPPTEERDEDSPEVVDGVCAMHASLRWTDNNRGKFSDADNIKEFCNDINYVIKVVPSHNVVELAKQLFFEKWMEREDMAVEAWMGFYHDKVFSRAELNRLSVSPLCFGIPADNNALEATNKTDKDLLERQKNHSSVLLPRLAELVIRPISCGDTRYHTKLRSNSRGASTNAAPNNKDFFQKAYRVLEKDHLYGKLFGELTFAFQSPQNDVPAGSFLHVSNHGLAYLKEDDDFKALCNDPQEPTKREYLEYFKPYAKTFKDMVTKGMMWMRTAERNHKNFAYFKKVMLMFNIMRPILPNGDSWKESAVEHWVHTLEYTGIPCKDATEICGMKTFDTCLLACSCRSYMHYGLCKHSFCFAFKRGIITGWPDGDREPTKLPVKRSKKRKMHAGDALNREG